MLDKDIREPLFDFLEEKYGKNRILEEIPMGVSRADVVMVTEGYLYGIEIKSDGDTYVRLERQIRDYNKYFDYNIVVVGSSHALHISEHVPDSWGIISVQAEAEEADFYVLREPERNALNSWKKKIEFLWRPELAGIQEKYNMPKYKEKSKAFVQDKILTWIMEGKIPEEEFSLVYTNILFERDYNAIADVIMEYRRANAPKRRIRKKKYKRKNKKE